MKEFLKKRKYFKIMTTLFALVLTVLCVASPCFAVEGTGTQLELNFDTSEMFQWTNLMLSVFKPILYISLGVGLAFTIVAYLRSVF